MKVLITDANILIDLLKTETISRFFKLDYEIHTTQSVINECDDEQQEVLNRHIRGGRLLIFSMGANDDDHIEYLLGENPGLSHADCTVLYVARNLDAILLTGDRKLRSVTLVYNIEVRGIFWVFDEMLKQKIIEKKVYIKKLLRLKEVNRWLPEDEFKKRLKN